MPDFNQVWIVIVALILLVGFVYQSVAFASTRKKQAIAQGVAQGELTSQLNTLEESVENVNRSAAKTQEIQAIQVALAAHISESVTAKELAIHLQVISTSLTAITCQFEAISKKFEQNDLRAERMLKDIAAAESKAMRALDKTDNIEKNVEKILAQLKAMK